jgi:hypothetical protein
MADILGMMDYIGRRTDQGVQQGKQSRLAGLYQQALQGPREQRGGLIAQMAGVSPQAAFDAEKHFGGMDDNARQRLGQYAAAFDALPDEQKPQAYPQLAQQAQQLGIPAPTQWDPSYAPNIQKLAQSLGGMGSAGGMFSQKVGEDGFIYNTDRSGRVTNTGVKADRQMWLRDQPGIDPGLVSKDGTVRPLTAAGSQQQMAPGEVPFSIDPSLPPAVQAAIRANPQQFARMSDGQSVAIGGAPSGVAAARPAQTPDQIAKQARTLAPEEVAARGYRPGSVVQVDGYGNETVRQAPQQDRQSMSDAERKAILAAKAKVPQLQNAIRGLTRIEEALKGLDGGMVNTGPLDQYAQRYTKQGQELEAAVGGIQNAFLALTRVPGIGAQSDLEARIAAMQYPSLDKDPEVNRRTMQQLREFATDLANAYRDLLSNGGAQQAGQPQHGRSSLPPGFSWED